MTFRYHPENSFNYINNNKKLTVNTYQEPITRSMQLPYNRVTAFSQTTDLFIFRSNF